MQAEAAVFELVCDQKMSTRQAVLRVSYLAMQPPAVFCRR